MKHFEKMNLKPWATEIYHQFLLIYPSKFYLIKIFLLECNKYRKIFFVWISLDTRLLGTNGDEETWINQS